MSGPSPARRGATLATVLLILSVSAVLVFSFASLTTVQLRTSLNLESKDHARNLAESMLYLGMDRLAGDPGFGRANQSLSLPLRNYPKDSQAALTFDAGQASALGIPQSFNNLNSKTPATVGGFRIPGESVRLVGLGKCGDTRVVVECLYNRPAFPTGLVSGGDLDATGLYLAGLIPGQPFNGNLGALTPDQLRPADVHANKNSAQAVKLDATSVVRGDVSTVGGVLIADGATIRGEVRTHTAPQQIPRLNITDIRARMAANNVQPNAVAGSNLAATTIDWFDQASSDLTIHGDLTLRNGLLYVTGNLVVHGKVVGTGAVLSQGSITIDQSSNATSSDQLTLAAHGNLHLSGVDPDNSFFHGLVYSDANINLERVTVVGTVVGHGDGKLENVHLVQTEVSSTLSLGTPMSFQNNDDTVFWKVDPVRNPLTGQVTYNYQWALYYAPWVTQNNHGQYFIGAGSGQNKTRDQVVTELQAAVDGDYQAEQASARPSDLLMQQLPAYLDAITAGSHGNYVVSLELNRVLAPSARARVLAWRRL